MADFRPNRRELGAPYKLKDYDNANLILSKLRKDISKKWMFLCATETGPLEDTTESIPTTNVEKENPDRPISLDLRAIADLGRIDLRFDTLQ